jgi:hypothetical protein
MNMIDFYARSYNNFVMTSMSAWEVIN